MKKILIVIDMQNDFITGSLGSEEAKRIVRPLSNYIKDFDGPVIYTMDTHDEDYLNTQEGKNLPIKHCLAQTPGWFIPDELYVAKDPYALFKSTFGKIELKDIIEKHSQESDYEIEICGICTDICVISNALILKTLFPEIKISVLKDFCAGTTKENHEAALTVMRSCQIDVR